ncbi:superoxide dismutase family protein [uncultured Roseivirga sp.]|uniref:superoxide dismutase family protein n=2 Tax=uncultured Roseivirga sp. TaxID=543088 RepID=UPI0030DB96A6
MKKQINGMLLICAVAAMTFGCSQSKEKSEQQSEPASEKVAESLKTVTVDLASKSDSKLKGTVIFKELANGKINIDVNLMNIEPGDHAVHIHAVGDCSAADGTSAGGHWNPMNVAHGNRAEGGDFHQGDIGNLNVREDGNGSLSMDVEGWTIGGDDSTNILNKALIVHAGPDDFTSQPAGAAGPRIGCGVIAMN